MFGYYTTMTDLSTWTVTYTYSILPKLIISIYYFIAIIVYNNLLKSIKYKLVNRVLLCYINYPISYFNSNITINDNYRIF